MKNIVAGNWKSNKLMNEALELMDAVSNGLPTLRHTEVLIAPAISILIRDDNAWRPYPYCRTIMQCFFNGSTYG